MKIVVVIKDHLAIFWDDDEDELEEVELSKLDVTQDLKGSFMPVWKGGASEYIKDRLNAAVVEIFGNRLANFLSLGRISDLKVVKGQNNLDTCYQYEIKDSNKNKILNVKVYDKMIDLVAREGTHEISSRIANIVGSKHTMDSFDRKLQLAKDFGMTRLEVSICHGAFRRFGPQ